MVNAFVNIGKLFLIRYATQMSSMQAEYAVILEDIVKPELIRNDIRNMTLSVKTIEPNQARPYSTTVDSVFLVKDSF